jgi:PAS domain S-box-containing protein
VADKSIPPSDFGISAIHWFLADAISVLGIAPFLIIQALPWLRRSLALEPWKGPRESNWHGWQFGRVSVWLEACGQALAGILVVSIMAVTRFQFSFLCLIPILWIAMRQGIRRSVTGLLVLNCGLVIILQYSPLTTFVLVKVSVLLMVMSATGLLVGASISERERITAELANLTLELSRANENMTKEVAHRKRSEEELRSQTAFLEAQANSTIDAILVVDQGGRVLLRNRRMLEIFKLPGEIAATRDDGPLLAHVVSLVKDRHSFLERVRYLYDHPGETSRDEMLLNDGTILDRYSSPVNDSDGNCYGRVWIFRDVTEQRRDQEALLQLSLAVEQSPSSIVITDARGNITYVNRKFCQCSGYSAEEAVGSNPRILKSGYVSDDTYRELWQEISCGREWRGDLCNRKKNGDLYWESATIAPVINAKGKISHFLAIKEDITERRAIEAQLRHAQKLEAVGQLAAGIAHEINTPTQFVADNLTFLKDACQTIQALVEQYRNAFHRLPPASVPPGMQSELDQAERNSDLEFLTREVPSAIDQALEGASRVAKIVRAMKEFSHPDSSEKAPADLNRAIETTVTVARNEWKYFADLKTDLDPKLPPVPCHLGEVNQVILNLVVNAAHTIKEKTQDVEKGLITITTRNLGDKAEISVADTGMGIPESVRHRVFDPFFTTKEVGKGTGQGLALAYAVVVKKHGGKIWFETKLGKGTVFFVHLPF